uniref:Uncharacterized protein n=1 Tax=Alexandrium monilatum TaxID=311494 RepID=A0A7S4T3D1_9DINO
MEPFPPGSVVKGRFVDSEWYAATVEEALGDGLYRIAWLDGDTADCLKRPHELRLMRYHRELKRYLEVPSCADDMQAVSQSMASDQPTHEGSDSKSDSDDTRAPEIDNSSGMEDGHVQISSDSEDAGTLDVGQLSLAADDARAPVGDSLSREQAKHGCAFSDTLGTGIQEVDTSSNEEVLSVMAASESESLRSLGLVEEEAEQEEEKVAMEREEDWMEQMVVALDGEAQDGRKPEGRPKGQLSPRRQEPRLESWQKLWEATDLRARAAQRALQIAKPPPAVSFTEMWCFDYFMRHAAPQAPRQSGPIVEEVGDLWLVVGGPEGGVDVRAGRPANSKRVPCRLSPGSLVRAFGCEGRRLRYGLLTGSGPAAGWVSIRSEGRGQLVKIAEGAGVEIEQSSGRNLRSWAALPVKSCRLADARDCLRCRCRVPVGGNACAGLEGEVLPMHAECLVRLLCQAQGALCAQLEEQRDEAESKEEEQAAIGKLLHMERDMQESLRAQYKIGWKQELVPSNVGPAARLGLELQAQGMCCLAVDGGRSVRLARTRHPGVCVNLEYLSIALGVGMLEGTQPWFSLDPVDPKIPTTMLSKNFGPARLAGTCVGEVLFQADYYLKELSMGQFKQPMPGMVSCWDFADGNAAGPDWDARIWFVVLEAEVNISEDDVLIPCVKMGVEARELVSGSYEDAAVTRKDHPLVKYAEMFTQSFDAIAERVSVVYYLRELAKASALAKFLIDNGYSADSAWLHLAADTGECQMEAPRLWNRRLSGTSSGPASVQLAMQEGSTNMLWGGVDLSLQKFVFDQAKVKRVAARLCLDSTDSSACKTPGESVDGFFVY